MSIITYCLQYFSYNFSFLVIYIFIFVKIIGISNGLNVIRMYLIKYVQYKYRVRHNTL